MSKQYKFTAENSHQAHKHGVDLTIYDSDTPGANVVFVSVDEGHFEEFYNTKSHFIYYITEGSGTFVLDDEKIEAGATDLIVVPPKTRVHYFGTMKMVLTVTPAFLERYEHHVRFVDRNENPYQL